MLRTFFHGSLLGLLALPLVASRPADPVVTAGPSGGDAAALGRALETISAAEISADLHFIASDAMRGRDTVSEEQRIAARFIRARLQRLGFRPGAGDGWFHTYPLSMNALDRATLSASLGTGGGARDLTYGVDYRFPDGFGAATMTTEGVILDCGAGEKEDFDAVDVTGAWALCRIGAEGNSYRIRSRARRAGAIGVALMASPNEAGLDLVQHFAGADEPAFAGRVGWPSSNTGGSGGRASFPMVALSNASAEAVLAAPGATLSESRALAGGGTIEAENVAGLWPGKHPELSKEVIILSAHYDHVGVRGEDIYNGADDNGSGTCGLLAVAEALAAYGPLDRSVLMLWVSGEEKGLWGSRAWAANPILPEGFRAVCDLNTDMIGRTAPSELYVTPSPLHKDYNVITKLAERFAAEEGFGGFPEAKEQGLDGLGSGDAYYMRSDHASFAELGIPVCFLFAGEHEDYHQPSDTPDKIDYDKISRVVRVVVKMLDVMQSGPLEE